MVILAGDVGATKILLEVGESRSGGWKSHFSKRYETRSEGSFSDVLREFLEEYEPLKPNGHAFTAAAFGVAGPASGNKVQMTHRPWVVDGDLISRRFPIPKVRVVNDLAAAAHGIDWLGADEIAEIQPGEAMPGEPRVVLGVGTGLGVSYRICVDGRMHEVSGEAGHANFAPANCDQVGLWNSIQAAHGRACNEDVLSGKGLQNIYAYTTGGETLAAEQISLGAMVHGDAQCTNALNMFTECLASVAGDLALAVLARGGVYLAGGIVAKNTPWLQSERFRSAFCAKGSHSSILIRIPVRAVKSERVAVIGAARIASEG